jgi:uncharacterized OB-fold protein
MQADTKEELLTRLRGFEGVPAGPPQRARFPVNEPMIHHWCDAIGDANPAYTDPQYAAASRHGGLVAPPTMLQAWTMRGLRPSPSGGGAQAELFALLDAAGFTSVVATNCTQDYDRYLRAGDELTCEAVIERISEEKRTALGPGHFVDLLYTFRDAAGERVAGMRFRLLRFRPPEARQAEPGAAESSAPAEATASRRPRPGITHDNAFFWEGVRQGELRIQRCAECGRLRHPPGPMCPSCRSLRWEAIRASGRGHVYSFVVHHHPRIPPFPPAHPVALIELEEGTRLVADLVRVEPSRVRIGMPVEVEFNAVDEELVLPQFRPVEAGASS